MILFVYIHTYAELVFFSSSVFTKYGEKNISYIQLVLFSTSVFRNGEKILLYSEMEKKNSGSLPSMRFFFQIWIFHNFFFQVLYNN
jgi:hypothetical protein